MEDKYNHQETEQTIKELWHNEKVFTFDRQVFINKKRPIFSIDTPPPTVSGSLHIGHIFSYTQADIIARFSRMSGYEVFYPFGFDDNGLATERFVEKKRKISAFALGRSAFIQACLEETEIAEKQFKDLWESIGLSVDWNLWYSTIAANIRKISQESFIRLYKDGHIYRKQEPALYCTTCRTSVAQAELEDKEISSHFYDIIFTSSSGEPLNISTTRPELLASCVALFYNPTDTHYQSLKNKKAVVPVFNYEVPIRTDELVDPTKGTGLVMCCTFGDKNDIIWYKKHKLEYRPSIDLNGKWAVHTGFLAGLNAQQAREAIIQKLTEAGALVNQRPITHTVNVHERCKKEIEYLILSQWFINILDHKKEFLACADQIAWYPQYMKTRYINWVENLGWDWCISRQRFFGIAFPVWHCDSCNNIVLADITQLPVDPQETVYQKNCPICGKNTWRPDTDVMDTWNTSALTPYIGYSLLADSKKSVLENTPEIFPLSMRPQAHDIIRTWAFYTIVKAWFHNKTIPWSTIVISGHVLSSAAEKISKSQDNAPTDPIKLVAQWSADAVRFWTASATLGIDTPFSENQIKIGQRTITKLWNAFKFLHINTQTITPQKVTQVHSSINQWILHEATAAFNAYKQSLENKEFGTALHHIEQFFWQLFCDNYLELIKPQLFKPEEYQATEVEETRQTLYQVGLQILQMYAPYIPFVTEKIYQIIYCAYIKTPSLHRTLFSEIQYAHNYQESAHSINTLLKIITGIRKLKSTNQLSLGATLDELIIYTDKAELKKSIENNLKLLKGIARVNNISLSKQFIISSITKTGEHIVMYLNIQEFIP
jgi:valyl-tRNA synthetase